MKQPSRYRSMYVERLKAGERASGEEVIVPYASEPRRDCVDGDNRGGLRPADMEVEAARYVILDYKSSKR